MRVFCAVVSTSCVVSEIGLVVVENMVFAPTCVHGPTPEERGIPVDAPAMASRMLPWNLEDVCRLQKLGKGQTDWNWSRCHTLWYHMKAHSLRP
uniref:Uncharacterized protein n=1 Tax=Oryzias latipes TaxID=8090 RepID=A0A3B3HW59_ORYLA